MRELGIDPPGAQPTVTGRAVRRGQVGRLPFDPRSLLTTKLLTPGSSLIVSDQGLGPETGARGTDFIVLTD